MRTAAGHETESTAVEDMAEGTDEDEVIEPGK